MSAPGERLATRKSSPEAWSRAALVFSLAGPLLLMLLLAWTPGTSMNEDLGRHLLLGRIITQGHSVPKTNLLTYTYPDFPFINHHWLSEVLLYQLHRIAGLGGLIFWKVILLTGTLALALFTARPRRGAAVYWFAGLLAAVILGYRAHIRPELFTYFGIAFYGWCFQRLRRGESWPRWAIVVYAFFWSNAHIYFLFGLAMCAAFVLERLAGAKKHPTGPKEARVPAKDLPRATKEPPGSTKEQPWATKVQPGATKVQPGATKDQAAGAIRAGGSWRQDLVWLGALILVSCVNPNGIAGLLYPFRIFSNYGIDVAENASPFQYWRTMVIPLLPALLLLGVLSLVAVVSTWRSRTARLADVLIVLASLVAAAAMARSAPLLALTALPVIGHWLEIRTSGPRRPRAANRDGARAAPVFRRVAATYGPPAAALVLNVWLLCAVWNGTYHRVFPAPVGPPPFGSDREEKYLALQALQKDGLRGPVFSNFNVGSLVEYNLYPERGYVDNRPEAFPASFWQEEYHPAFALDQRWERTLRQRGFNTIIVSFAGVSDEYTRALMSSPEWTLVHLDGLLGVWVRTVPANQSLIEKHRMDAARLDEFEQGITAAIDRLPGEPAWNRQMDAREALYQLYALYCVGETARIWPHLWRLYNLYPDYEMVHELMTVAVPPAHLPEVESLMSRWARWPVTVREVVAWGGVLEAQGALERARETYERGRWFFPLSPDLAAAAQRLSGGVRPPS